MLIYNKDDIEFINEFPCFLGHPVYKYITLQSPERIIGQFNLILYISPKYTQLNMKSVLIRSDVLVLGNVLENTDRVVSGLIQTIEYRESCIWVDTNFRIQREQYLG